MIVSQVNTLYETDVNRVALYNAVSISAAVQFRQHHPLPRVPPRFNESFSRLPGKVLHLLSVHGPYSPTSTAHLIALSRIPLSSLSEAPPSGTSRPTPRYAESWTTSVDGPRLGVLPSAHAQARHSFATTRSLRRRGARAPPRTLPATGNLSVSPLELLAPRLLRPPPRKLALVLLLLLVYLPLRKKSLVLPDPGPVAQLVQVEPRTCLLWLRGVPLIFGRCEFGD
ncbi:hypothetical protein VTK56DRAFT_8638 [Thermocarpiscus australiensis]